MKYIDLTYKKKLQIGSLFICIPILIITFIFSYLLNGPIEDRLLQEYTSSIRKQMNYLDLQVNQVEDFAYNLSYSLNGNINVSEINRYTEFTDVNRVSNQLFLLENNSLFVEKAIILVLSDDPYVITSGGTGSVGNILNYEKFSLSGVSDGREWKSINGNLYLLQNINSNNQKEAILAVQIDPEKMLSGLPTTSEDMHSMLLIDDSVIKKSDFPTELEKKILKNKNTKVYSIGAKKYNLVTEKYQYLNQTWTYYSAISFSGIYFVSKLSQTLMIICLICIILTFILTKIFSKIYYNPLKELLLSISPDSDLKNIDEFKYLHNKWDEIIHQRDSFVANSTKNKDRLSSTFIDHMIQGRYSYYSNEELLLKAKEFDLDFQPEDKYLLLQFQLTDFVPNMDKPISRDENLCSFLINNIIADLSKEFFDNSLIVSNQKNSVILFLTANNETEKENFENYLFQICKSANSLLGRYLTITISETADSLEQLPRQHELLYKFKKYQIMELSNQTIKVADYQSKRKKECRPVIDHLEKKIFDSIKLNDLNEIKQVTAELVNQFIKKRTPQIYFINAVRKMHNDLSSLLDINGLSTSVMLSENKIIEKISVCFRQEPLTEILLTDMLIPMTESIANADSDKISQKLINIIQSMKIGFSDPNISLEQTAEKFDIDIYTLSREFKRKVGMTYISFLTDLRIEAAKHLLRESDLRISEIAYKVGYQPSYFNRIFKKKVGITPGEYRKS